MEKWVDKTLYESKKNRDYSIIIDKFRGNVIFILNGSSKYEFEVELGRKLGWR